MSEPYKHKHRPCPCGCGELADECMKPSSGLNAFKVSCWRSECRAGCYYPDVCDQPDKETI